MEVQEFSKWVALNRIVVGIMAETHFKSTESESQGYSIHFKWFRKNRGGQGGRKQEWAGNLQDTTDTALRSLLFDFLRVYIFSSSKSVYTLMSILFT